MPANLLRTCSVNSRDIKFELEAALVALEEEKNAWEKLGPEEVPSPAAKRLLEKLQQEIIALERLYFKATGEVFKPPKPLPQREMEALKRFFEAMHGRRWLNMAGWLGRKGTAYARDVPPFSSNPWTWSGVECPSGKVSGLSLAGNQLQGEIPGDALAGLRGLITLDLSDNDIEGRIPDEVGELKHLQYLHLSVTKLGGRIPDTLGAIKGLRELDLSCSGLSGPIPACLGCCTKLVILNLSHNSLEGVIPSELDELRRLRELGLAHNRLTGPIPPSFSRLERLQALSLSCNSLEGPLDTWLSELTCLRRLLLDHNHFSGRIPEVISNLRDLKVIHMQFNRIYGRIPRSIGMLLDLRILNVSRNNLEGKVPAELGNLTKLAGLELGKNRLVGPLPVELGQLTRLVDFHALDGCPSYSMPLRRGFTRHAFERVFITGPALGLNNTTFPSGIFGRVSKQRTSIDVNREREKEEITTRVDVS